MGDAHHCSVPPISEMTYSVSSGTLNPSIPYHTLLDLCLELTEEQRPQTTFLRPVLSWAAASIFSQLYLKPKCPHFWLQLCPPGVLGRPFLMWPRDVHCRACSAMLSSFLCSICPFHFLLSSVPVLVLDRFFSICLRCRFCLARVR